MPEKNEKHDWNTTLIRAVHRMTMILPAVFSAYLGENKFIVIIQAKRCFS